MEQFMLTGLSVEELRELNRKAKEALVVVETKLDDMTTKVIRQGGTVITWTSDGQTTIMNSQCAQISYIDGKMSINGKPIEKPAFDQEKIKALEKAIPLLKHLRMISGLEIGFIQGDFEPTDMGYVLVPTRDVEAERKKINQFIEVCDQLIVGA